MWDLKFGIDIFTFTGHSNGVSTCGFSPDGKIILSASLDGTINLWDSQSFHQIKSINVIYDMESELANFRTLQNIQMSSSAFSPDGNTVLLACNDSLRTFDVKTGGETSILTGHSAVVTSCGYSKGGKMIISSSCDSSIKLWDVQTGQNIKTILEKPEFYMLWAKFSENRKYIFSTSNDSTLRIWDTVTGNQVGYFEPHSSSLKAAAILEKERKIECVCGDEEGNMYFLSLLGFEK